MLPIIANDAESIRCDILWMLSTILELRDEGPSSKKLFQGVSEAMFVQSIHASHGIREILSMYMFVHHLWVLATCSPSTCCHCRCFNKCPNSETLFPTRYLETSGKTPHGTGLPKAVPSPCPNPLFWKFWIWPCIQSLSPHSITLCISKDIWDALTYDLCHKTTSKTATMESNYLTLKLLLLTIFPLRRSSSANILWATETPDPRISWIFLFYERKYNYSLVDFQYLSKP